MRYKFGSQKERILPLELFFCVVSLSLCGSKRCVFLNQKPGETFGGREISFFSFSLPHNKTHFACSFAAHHIEQSNGIIRVRINIGSSLFGFEYGDEAGTKIIDGLDESDSSVVVDLCD